MLKQYLLVLFRKCSRFALERPRLKALCLAFLNFLPSVRVRLVQMLERDVVPPQFIGVEDLGPRGRSIYELLVPIEKDRLASLEENGDANRY